LRAQLRAAYASLGGASWLEAVARLFGGAPVAAKVAAIGVGAATVTSSAVVVPQVLEQHNRVVQHAKTHVTPSHVPAVQPEVAAPTPVFAAVRVVYHEQHDTRETADVEGHNRADGDHGTAGRSGETELEAVAPRKDAHSGDGGEDSRDGTDGRDGGESGDG
jgi:hypothetical protein